MTDLAVDPQHDPRPLSHGQLIGGRYRLDRIAGAGGMATVWHAHDERLQRSVAIKVMSDALAASPAAVARFAREARTHAGIQHPNLVQVYDYSIASAQPYLVMEYVDGATLSERLDRGGLTAATIQTLALELLSALACVHDHGVLHRDIKSGNVLLDRDGHARLTDFGLARLEDSSRITRPNEVVGTLRFLAPELIEGHPASRQSDLFALGVLLRNAATQAGCDPQMAKLTTRLTQHDPRARPADAHAALEFLRSRRQRVQPAARQRVKPPARQRAKPAPWEHVKPAPRQHVKPAARQHVKPARRRPGTSEDQPTEIFTAAASRRPPASQIRNRVFAISALLLAVAGTALAIATAGGGSPAHRAAPIAARPGTRSQAAYSRTALTIDQQLQRLATGVRAAART